MTSSTPPEAHAEAVEAGIEAGRQACCFIMPGYAARAMFAAFLRKWKPNDPIATRAEREQAKRLAKHAAAELLALHSPEEGER